MYIAVRSENLGSSAAMAIAPSSLKEDPDEVLILSLYLYFMVVGRKERVRGERERRGEG